MNKIVTVKWKAQDKKEIEKLSKQYSLFSKASVEEAFQAVEEGQFEKAASLCCDLLDYKVVPEIQMLLGKCYFMQGHMQSAAMVFRDLQYTHPQEEECRMYLGITDHALGNFEEAVKELEGFYPLKEYQPFYYTSYGDSLQQTGRLKRSRDAFYEEAAYFEKTRTIISPEMLDGAFQNLLYLDVTLGNGQYREDVKKYYDFLDQVEMTEEMQDHLAGNIVYFSHTLMSNKGYRPLFLEFITHIRDRNFLTTEYGKEVIASAFSSWESYEYHEDRRIGALMEEFLTSHHERKYVDDDEKTQEDRQLIEVKALSYEWYMCQYAPGHREEIEYVRKKYPFAYEDTRDIFERIESDREGTAGKLLDELYTYAREQSRSEFEKSMYAVYRRACEDIKDPTYMYDGMETYRRIQPKVGRNDPCPCGSGKKYKKCCGK